MARASAFFQAQVDGLVNHSIATVECMDSLVVKMTCQMQYPCPFTYFSSWLDGTGTDGQIPPAPTRFLGPRSIVMTAYLPIRARCSAVNCPTMWHPMSSCSVRRCSYTDINKHAHVCMHIDAIPLGLGLVVGRLWDWPPSLFILLHGAAGD